MTLPAGWQPHPENSAYAWNPATGEVKTVVELGAAAAGPAAAAGAAGGDPWGEQDMDAAEADRQSAQQDYSREKNFFWLDFPELKGNEVSLLMRFFPPWSPEVKRAYVEGSRHRVFARFVPDAPEARDIWWVECLNAPGGPGHCPICRVLINNLSSSSAQGASDFGKNAKGRKYGLWQGVNLNDPHAHYQDVDGVSKIVPGVLRASPTLHAQITDCFRFGNFTSPRTGFPIECIKKRGKFPQKKEMNVEYNAQHHAHMPGAVPADLWPALANIVDLRAECVNFPAMDKAEEIAQNILAEFEISPGYHQVPASAPVGRPGLPPGFLPHPSAPGHMYNPQTGAVLAMPAMPAMPAAAPAYPPAPPAPPAYPPAPPAPAAYPPAPPAYPPQAAPPPAPAAPPAYPPAAAPAYPQGPPAPPPAPPMAPPVPGAPSAAQLPPAGAPGLPPGAMPATPPPPMPGAPPPAAAPGMPPMPPSALEAQMGMPGMPPMPAAPPAAPAAPPVPGVPPVEPPF